MAAPVQTASDVSSDYSTLEFIVQAILGRAATAKLVKVVACTNSGGVAKWGTVDVVPLVNMVAGDGTQVSHGTVYRLPYHRLQGAACAVILDPVAGDIGLAVIADRDSSAVRADPVKAASNADGTAGTPPGSARQFDVADGMYFGGFMNAAPTTYLQFLADGSIVIHSPVKVTVTAPEVDLTASSVINLQAPTINLKGAVVQTGGNASMAQNLTVTGDASVGGNLAVTGTSTGTGAASFAGGVTGAGVVLQTHRHLPGTYVAGATPVTGNAGNPI
jgi:hypothetical protein